MSFLQNPHFQSMYRGVKQADTVQPVKRIFLESAHGDRLAMDYRPNSKAKRRLLILHGITGCSTAASIKDLMAKSYNHGWEPWALNFRGAGQHVPSVPRLYHGGSWDDLDIVSQQLPTDKPWGVIGYSLGANIMVGWLAECSLKHLDLRHSVGISCPLQLWKCAANLETSPIQKIYRIFMVSRIKSRILALIGKFPGLFDPKYVQKIHTFYELDNKITGPLHGYKDAMSYWSDCSSCHYINKVQSTVTLLNSQDDPFFPSEQEVVITNPKAQLLLADKGGHLGFFNPIGQSLLEEAALSLLEEKVQG